MRKAPLLLGIAALMGCGTPDRTAGGSSYETENAVAVRIVRLDGTPALGTLVRARRLAWLEGDSFDSTFDRRTDADGQIRLDLPAGAWRLEARQAGAVAVIEIPAQGRISELVTVSLAVPASVVGRTQPGTRVGASGLSGSTVADAGGVFHFDSLPAGVHVLRQIGSTARAFVLARSGESLDAGILRADSTGQILIDDFEDGDTRSRFGPWTGGGQWWVDADSGIRLSPDSVREKPGRAIVADGLGGKVLQFSAAFSTDANLSARARCGVDFGPRPLDLSGLASVRFRARGIGVITVMINSDSAAPSEIPQASAALDSVWQEFEIPLARLHAPSWTGTALDSASRAQRLRRSIGLIWSRSGSGDIWLDNIRIVGPSTSLLWGSSPPP